MAKQKYTYTFFNAMNAFHSKKLLNSSSLRCLFTLKQTFNIHVELSLVNIKHEVCLSVSRHLKELEFRSFLEWKTFISIK